MSLPGIAPGQSHTYGAIGEVRPTTQAATEFLIPSLSIIEEIDIGTVNNNNFYQGGLKMETNWQMSDDESKSSCGEYLQVCRCSRSPRGHHHQDHQDHHMARLCSQRNQNNRQKAVCGEHQVTSSQTFLFIVHFSSSCHTEPGVGQESWGDPAESLME